MCNYIVVIGYGIKGKMVVVVMVSDELVLGEIVVVDIDLGVFECVVVVGLVIVYGDVIKFDVLRLVGI